MRFPISTRIILGVTLILCVGLVSMAAIYFGMVSVRDSILAVTEGGEPSIQAVNRMRHSEADTVAHVQRYLDADDLTAAAQVADDQREFREAVAAYLKLADAEISRELGNSVAADYERLVALGTALTTAKQRREQLGGVLASQVKELDGLVGARLTPKPEDTGPDFFDQDVKAKTIRAETDLLNNWLPEYLRRGSPKQRSQMLQHLELLDNELQAYGRLRLNAGSRAGLQQVLAKSEPLERSFAELFALDERLARETPRFTAEGDHLYETLDGEIQRATMRRLGGAKKDADHAVTTVMYVISFFVPAFVLCCVIAAVLLILLIRNPVQALMKGTTAVASGDLQYRIPAPGRDEFGELAEQFNRMVDQLEATTVSKERLEASEQKLQEEDVRKNEFLAMLGHELRNPLGALSNAVHLLQNEGPESRSPATREIIARQVRNMSRLVDDLLEVARITRGKVELRKEQVDAVDAARHAAHTARSVIEGRRHRLVVSLPTAPVWVEADGTRLEQIVTNLLNNAAKYTEPGGEITLTVETRQAGTSRSVAVVRVRDTGIGIAPEMLPRVFELFTQADRSLDRAQGGLGIGLTLVRRLVEMHGGSVTAHSEGVGRGSEFTVTLPLLTMPAAPVAAPVEGSQPAFRSLHPARILVVDDNTDAAETLVEILQAWGHVVDAVPDGFAAIERAKVERPDLVLLDIGLPGMDGYEVARRLRQSDLLAETRLVAVTGYAQEEDRERSREAGFDAHLAKPLDLDALKELVPDLTEARQRRGVLE